LIEPGSTSFDLLIKFLFLSHPTFIDISTTATFDFYDLDQQVISGSRRLL